MSLRGRLSSLERRAGFRPGVCPRCRGNGEGLHRVYITRPGVPPEVEHCPVCGARPPHVSVLVLEPLPDGKGGFLELPV